MDLQQLRARTEQEHLAVEGIMPLMNPDLSLSQYRQTLRGLYGVIKSWDDWAERHAPADLAALVRARRRSSLLEVDLCALDDKVTVERPQLILPADKAGFLGAMYVIEGSTLGGQHIARHIGNVLGLDENSGASYFVGYGEQTGSRWREFQSLLRAVPEHHTEEVIAGALAMFTQFRFWMLQTLQSL